MISNEQPPQFVFGRCHWDGKPTGGPGGELRWHNVRTIETSMFVQYPNVHEDPNQRYKQLAELEDEFKQRTNTE